MSLAAWPLMSSPPQIVGGDAPAVAVEARATPFVLVEQPGHITEVTVTLDATPAQIYALVTDYTHWREVFSDITSVTVKSGGRRDAKVQFSSKALVFTVTVEFDNTPDQRISFRGIQGPPGGRAHGSYDLTPVAGGTRVHAKLFMDVVGVPGLFIGDAKVRAMRQAKLRADITDVMRRFPACRSSN
jgi:carbon monoxide dehydrogenase subunit G